MLDAENPFEEPLDPDEATEDDDDAGDAEGGQTPLKRRRRRSPKHPSPLHEARIDEYRHLIETRGWIFSPPSPELPISSLFEHLTTKQIVGLGEVGRRTA